MNSIYQWNYDKEATPLVSESNFSCYVPELLDTKFTGKEAGGVDMNKCHHKFGGKV